MIRTEYSVPEVYYKESRDFQFLGRVFDAVFNSLKTNSELVSSNPFSDNFNTKLIDLLTLTLGFKPRHHYNIAQLTAMCSTFVEAVRYKGTKKSIQLAVDAILNSQGISQKNSALIFEYPEECRVQIFVPMELEDLNLLNDILDYLLPAGMNYEIIRQLGVESNVTTALAFTNSDEFEEPEFKNVIKDDVETSIVPQKDVDSTYAGKGLIDTTTVVGKGD